MANFETSVAKVLNREGGSKITNDKDDKGKLTKFGISQKAYPKLDIANLTEDAAKAIYKRDYWDCIMGDKIAHQGIAFMIFDCAVNSSVARAVIFAQKALGVAADSIFGNVTLNALNECDAPLFIDRYTQLRLEHYKAIVKKDPTQKKWANGWRIRAEEVRLDAKR